MGVTRRTSYHHGDLREALITAAVELVASGGPQAFSLREAARRVGVDPAACYRHFHGRDALLQAVASQGFAGLGRLMEARLARKRTPRSRLEAMGHAYVEFALENGGHFRAMFGPNGVGARGPLVRGTGVSGRTPYEMLTDNLGDLERATPLSMAVDEAAMSLWSGVHGLACLLLEGAWRPASPVTEVPASVTRLVRALLVGITRPG